jgi:hypothetical protein
VTRDSGPDVPNREIKGAFRVVSLALADRFQHQPFILKESEKHSLYTVGAGRRTSTLLKKRIGLLAFLNSRFSLSKARTRFRNEANCFIRRFPKSADRRYEHCLVRCFSVGAPIKITVATALSNGDAPPGAFASTEK